MSMGLVVPVICSIALDGKRKIIVFCLISSCLCLFGHSLFIVGLFGLKGDGAKLEISKTNFTDVSAANAGGALFAKDVPEISVTSVVIDGAEGKSGGGTSIEGAKDVIFSKSEILSCDAVFGVSKRTVHICPSKQGIL